MLPVVSVSAYCAVEVRFKVPAVALYDPEKLAVNDPIVLLSPKLISPPLRVTLLAPEI